MMNILQSHSRNDSGDLRGVAGGDGELGCLCEVSVMWVIIAPPIHLGAWSMAVAAIFVLLFVCVYRLQNDTTICETKGLNY